MPGYLQRVFPSSDQCWQRNISDRLALQNSAQVMLFEWLHLSDCCLLQSPAIDPKLPGRLLSGEDLALLVDLQPIAKQAYLCRVTDAAVSTLACSDSGHDRLVQLLF